MTRWLMIAVALAACSKKASAPEVKLDAAEVNALVPADLKDKVTFEVGSIKDDFGHHKKEYKMVVPKGWKKGFMPASLEPADADSFGSKTLGKTDIHVGDNCDGECKEKDWAQVVDKVYYSQFTGGKVTGKLIKDEKGTNTRLMVFQHEPTVQENAGSASVTVNGTTTTTTVTATSGTKGITIIRTWWTPGDTKHFVCQVELGEPAMGLAAAFEKVCDKVTVSE